MSSRSELISALLLVVPMEEEVVVAASDDAREVYFFRGRVFKKASVQESSHHQGRSDKKDRLAASLSSPSSEAVSLSLGVVSSPVLPFLLCSLPS